MRLRLVVPLAFLVFSTTFRPAFADVREPGDVSAPLAIVTVVGTVLMVSNAVLWSQGGSEPAGAIGILVGATQIGLGMAIDNDNPNNEFKAFTITTGTLGVIAGAGSMLRGRSSKNLGARGIEVTPGVDLAHRWVGAQVTARW